MIRDVSTDPWENLKIAKYDPAFHIRHFQGVTTMEPYQVELCNSVRDHSRTVCKAVHGVGKTFIVARIGCWFLTSYPNSIVLTTAPTNRQVNHLLWKEIRAAKKTSPTQFGGKIYDKPYWKMSESWYALGYSPETDSGGGDGQGAGSAFQGYHAENMLIIVDEATGIKKQIWTQIEGMMTSGNCKIIAIGNPTSMQTEFYEKFNSLLWNDISISCFDSPNLKANNIHDLKDLKRELSRLQELDKSEVEKELSKYKLVNTFLTDARFVMSRALEWGIDHILFVTKVLGEFADEDDNAMFKLKDVEFAQNRKVKKSKKARYIGVDPARFGTDKTCITVLEGYRQTKLKMLKKKRTNIVAGEIIKMIRDLPRLEKEIILVDGTGIGAGVVDSLIEKQEMGLLPKSIMIKEIHFGGAPYDELDEPAKQQEDRDHYLNLKAKMFDLLAKDVKTRLKLIDTEIYQKQLPTIILQYDGKGRLKIESKDDYKKRTKKPSPDESDSIAIANFGRYIHFDPPDDYETRITVL